MSYVTSVMPILTGGNPMTSAESLEKYGTITFGIDHMQAMVYADRPMGRIECGRWIATIPEVYRDDVIEAATRVAERYVGVTKLTDESLHALICEMHAAVCQIAAVRPRHLVR